MKRKIFLFIITSIILHSITISAASQEVTVSDVEKAMYSQTLAASTDYDFILDGNPPDGVDIKNIKKETIYRIYSLLNQNDDVALGCSFENYLKDGDLKKDFYDYYQWVLPVEREDGKIQEYIADIYQKNVSISKGSIIDTQTDKGLIYNHERLADIINTANIGKPELIIAGFSVPPATTYFIYVETGKGSYIIPTMVAKSNYNSRHEDKNILNSGGVYTVGEYIEYHKKELQGWKEMKQELKKKQENKPQSETHYIDDNGDEQVITPTPTASPSPTPTPVPSITPSPTPEPSPMPTTSPSPMPQTLTTTQMADNLRELGLFKGTGNGYELDKTFTRAEGATMLVRLLGKEEEALLSSADSGFIDVRFGEHWAAPYVAYCVRNNITKGTSETTFEPEQKMSGTEYITLVLRALGYSGVTPETVFTDALKYKLISSEMADGFQSADSFTRNDMVVISYMALTTVGSDGESIIDKLINSKIITKEKARELGF